VDPAEVGGLHQVVSEMTFSCRFQAKAKNEKVITLSTDNRQRRDGGRNSDDNKWNQKQRFICMQQVKEDRVLMLCGDCCKVCNNK
jgi:hypothetical protein